MIITNNYIINIAEMSTFDESNYDYFYCPTCKRVFCWKPKTAKVHNIRLSKQTAINVGTLVFPCKRCHNNYLITTEAK